MSSEDEPTAANPLEEAVTAPAPPGAEPGSARAQVISDLVEALRAVQSHGQHLTSVLSRFSVYKQVYYLNKQVDLLI